MDFNTENFTKKLVSVFALFLALSGCGESDVKTDANTAKATVDKLNAGTGPPPPIGCLENSGCWFRLEGSKVAAEG